MAEKKNRRFTVRVHLTSGRIIKFRARSISLTPRSDGPGYSAWSVDGMPVLSLWGLWRHRRPFSIDPRSIVAVETTGV